MALTMRNGKYHDVIYAGMDSKGKRKFVSITCDTKSEYKYQKAKIISERNENKSKVNDVFSLTVGEVIDKYIDKCDVLSPTTKDGYERIRAHAFPDLMDIKVCDLTDELLQDAINDETKRPRKQDGKKLSAKSVKNEWGLVSSALRTICKLSFDVNLPTVQHKNKILPEPELVLNAVKGTAVELPCLLACWLSFSMSEIRGLRCSSVVNGKIYVDQVMVDTSFGPVLKSEAKVDTRIRMQSLPDYIMELISESETYKEYLENGKDGPLINMNRNQIYDGFQSAMAKEGIHIPFHDLRHIFASVMLTKLQIPEKVVQAEGGWKTNSILKTVYSNTFTNSRLEADSIRDNYFNSLLTPKLEEE